MSGSCQTLDSLIALGFEHRRTSAGLNGVGYRFGHLDLDAVHVMNLYARYVVLLSGVLNTGRTVAVIENQIPDDLSSPVEAAAWVSFALRSHRSELEPLPDWFFEGEGNWDLVWPVIEGREAYERRRAYESCPKCHIDRDYARVLRRNLSEELSWLGEEAGMTFSFDGRVLSIGTDQRVHELVAYGDSWPSSYRVIVSPETKLPARFTSWRGEISVFEGFVSFDRLRLGPCEPVE